MLWERIVKTYKEKYLDDLSFVTLDNSTFRIDTLGEKVLVTSATEEIPVRVVSDSAMDSKSSGFTAREIKVHVLGTDIDKFSKDMTIIYKGVEFSVYSINELLSIGEHRVLSELFAKNEIL